MLRNFAQLKPFLPPFLLAFIYFLLIASPYFFSKVNRFDSLGVLSLVEEKSEGIKKTGKAGEHLLAGEKITGKVSATDNNLGIVLVRFTQLALKVSDTVRFRIKQEGQEKWYYENSYNANQFHSDNYFTFGFPIIKDSKNKVYAFEIMSLAGTGKNGIGLSPKKPQVALVYKPTKENLISLDIFSFISKKLIYVLNNLNTRQNWLILVIYLLAALFVSLVRKKKNKLAKKRKALLKSTTGFFLLLWDLLGSFLKITEKFSSKLISKFYKTWFYSMFLNTNVKKRLAIGLFIFLIAFLYRFSATDQLGMNSFYAGLGGQGDYDQFIRAATCALNFCSWIVHQNLLIESLILGSFYHFFGFVGGLKTYSYLMLILSAIVATLPYILLSRKNWLTISGIIGGTFLAGSDFLTRVAISFPPDNLSLFTFSIFYIVYLFTLHVRTIRWLIMFGLAGLFDGLTKALFLINDLVVFVLFVPIFYFEKAISRGARKNNIRTLVLSFIPLIVFAIGYISWEILVYVKFDAAYFLKGLLETRGESFVSYTSFNDRSLTGDIVFQLFFLLVSIIIMLKRLIEHTGLQLIFLAPIFLGLLYITFIRKNSTDLPFKKLIFVIAFSAVLICLLVLTKNNYLGIHDALGDYIYAWSNITFVNVFLFVEIILLFILNFRYSALKQTLPILPYVIMLVILTKNSPFARLHTHVVAFAIILLAYLVDFILENTYLYSKRKGIVFGSVLLILFMFLYTFPKTVGMITRLNSGTSMVQDQAVYLKWVEGSLPENAVILAGGKSDLVVLAENVKKPIIYSSLYSAALLIKPNEIPGISPTDFTIIGELQNKNNFKKKKYLILEDDIHIWRSRLSGVADGVFTADPSIATALHGKDYSIKVYKYNPTLKKGIYELKLQENSNL